MPKRKNRRRASGVTAYTDPGTPGALGGVARYAKAQGLSLKEARDELQGELAYTLHRPVRRRFQTSPVLVFHKDDQWQADLVEMQPLKKWNGGNRYLLTVIDVLSKYAWAVPVKNKTGVAVTEALEKILRQSGRKPLRLQTDAGKEFYNVPFKRLLEKEGIHHFSTHGDAKASIVERFNRTLKQRMYRYFTARNTRVYVNVLSQLLDGYNGSRHRSIGMAPRDVTEKNEGTVWSTLYGKRLKRRPRPKLKVGDRVRLSKKHRPFKKGYLPGWTEEVFVVQRVVPGPVVTYKLKEWDGTPLEGSFYEEDVQKVTVPNEALFRVEKILQRRGRLVKVRWLGWPKKYDSWIPRSALKHV